MQVKICLSLNYENNDSKIPDSLDLSDRELAMLVASMLYEEGKLSIGQAAEVAGLSKLSFIELLGERKISVFNYPVEDLKTDMLNA